MLDAGADPTVHLLEAGRSPGSPRACIFLLQIQGRPSVMVRWLLRAHTSLGCPWPPHSMGSSDLDINLSVEPLKPGLDLTFQHAPILTLPPSEFSREWLVHFDEPPVKTHAQKNHLCFAIIPAHPNPSDRYLLTIFQNTLKMLPGEAQYSKIKADRKS